MGMKKIVSTVGVRIRGNELPFALLVEDIDNTSKSINFKIDRNLYRKFEHIVGRGNVSKVIRKFILATVKKYEKLSDPSPSNFLKEVERAGKRQKERREQRDRE
jgi:hypothetical protein